MIKGVGTDICQMTRFDELYAKQGERFAKRVLSIIEQQQEYNLLDESKRSRFVAKRFAMKEAISKALGTGIGKHLSFQDISIKHDCLGKPICEFSEQSKEHFNSSLQVHISLSDEIDYVVAFAVWED